MQSASLAHAARQSVPAALQRTTSLAQATKLPGVQPPAPLQLPGATLAGVAPPPALHTGSQLVAAPGYWQAARSASLPSQLPTQLVPAPLHALRAGTLPVTGAPVTGE